MTTRGPDATARRRGRRHAVLAIVLVVVGALAVLGGALVASELLATGQLVLFVGQVLVAAPILVVAARSGARRMRRRHDAVAAAAGAEAVVTILRMDAMQWSQWLGARALVVPFPMLVDDAEGFGLWTLRKGAPVEVMRRPWTSVRAIVRSPDGIGLRMEPVDDEDAVLTLLPVGLEGSTPQRMETPGRVAELLEHLRARHRAGSPSAPPDDRVVGGRDVDWLAPPDRTRPSR